MADVLNQCFKCECRLSAVEKPSKLLPCLHTVCVDCISGKTDVLQKLSRTRNTQKEEKSDLLLNKQSEHAADERGDTKADDKETKVKNTQDRVKKEEDNEGKDGSVQDPERSPGEETSVEGVGETPPEPVPLKECPVCKEPFTEGSVIDNIFARKKAEALEVDVKREQMCTGCELNAAASYCMQCDDWLCSDCVTAHKRVRMTKDHQLSSLDEAVANKSLKGDGGSSGEVNVMCKDHPKEKLSLFCEKCEVLTCRDCQLLQHQEHKYHFLQDAADTYKMKLKGSVSLMKDRRNTLHKCLKEIEERLDKVTKDKASLQQEILHQADIVVKAVRTSVWAVLNSLHSFTDAASKRLSREIGDVGDLVGKFDHCIQFMEAILDDGVGTSLLHSKSFVEGKCRKVYHTQMEPQSLKGQLKLQYRHDVPVMLRFLPNFGAIYINGTKYPPEKPQQSSAPPTTGSAQNNTGYSGSGMMAGTAAFPRQALPSKDRMMKVAMSAQGQAGVVPSLGLIVPSSSNSHRGLVTGGWPAGLAVSPSSRMMGVMVPGSMGSQQRVGGGVAPFPVMAMKLQQHQQQPGSVAGVLMSAGPAAGGGGQQKVFTSDHTARLRPILPAPSHSSRGPPPYPDPQDGSSVGSGSQLALSLLSGTRIAGIGLDPMPDPARPASGGGTTPDQPLSSDGAASSSRVKTEQQNGDDCIITSAKLKGKKSSVPMVTATLGEMQKNLDDVLRSVPLDLTDNLEPIRGCDSEQGSNGKSAITTTALTTAVPTSSVVSTSSVDSAASVTTAASSRENKEEEEGSSVCVESEKSGERGGSERGVDLAAKAFRMLVVMVVGGYATGNSMPGFALGSGGAIDPNDDYCAACHQGGDVLCCDRCPRVFHLQCHVPVLSTVPSGAFVCTLCEEPEAAAEGAAAAAVAAAAEAGGRAEVGVGVKRKAPTGLTDRDLKLCERILLELFCHPSSIPFHEPVNRAVPNYYKIITTPMDFTNIKCKLTRSHFNHYATVESFLDDCKLVFRNCAVYNAEASEVGKAGRQVREFFQRLVTKHMPELSSYVSQAEPTEGLESERKKRKVASSSSHHHHHHLHSHSRGK
ncbi:E3 ubiquitin-protein ligase TRIM33-like [Babylonia areolata]|uniref:E3 ubiquitin-protein ligase TRIM33-like n=1 Tax=Babylonia areolata TaxID=304850 RepID=UPI003FD26550